VDALFSRAIDTLRAQGATIVDPADITTQGKFDNEEQTVLLYEFKDGVNRYLANRGGVTPRSLAQLMAFNNNERVREMPFFGQELFVNAQAKGLLSDKDYVDARERGRRLAGVEGIDVALAKDHLDALIAPTTGAAWTTDWVNGDHFLGGGVSTAPAVAGYPHITVPMGLVRGLPVGLSLVGTAWSEPRLISYAYTFEQASHARTPPHFTASVP
jgi:amidase